MTSGPCSGCGALVPDSASFCPSCGSPLDADVDLRTGPGLQPAGAPGQPPASPEQVASPGRRGPSGVVIAVVVVAVLVAALVLGDCSGDDSAEPPTTTTTTTTQPSSRRSAPGPSLGRRGTTSTSAVTTSTAPPAEVAALGLEGSLYVLRADGQISSVDLATGRARQVLAGGALSGLGLTTLAVLEAGAVFGDWDGGSTALAFDGSAPVELGSSSLAAASPAFAVLADRDLASFTVVDGHGRELTAFGSDVGARAFVEGVAGGRAVLQASGRIGLVDPFSGSAEVVATGHVLAANDWGLVRVDCPALLSCQLVWGPWGDIDRTTVALATLPPDTFAAELAADGAALLVQSRAGWWLLGAEGETLLQGAATQQVRALGTAEAVAVQRTDVVTLHHVDGRVVTVLDLGTGAELRRPVVALSYVPAR
ncbi:MAG: hypothetical protein GEV08_11630 [Acidimicrobiia bacterium]|nr:hypothetical protein [Acidimicrobiia bacterium]